MAWKWELSQQACTGCGICADVCLHQAIDMTRAMAYPALVPLACVGCRDCVTECPVDALVVRESCEPRPPSNAGHG